MEHEQTLKVYEEILFGAQMGMDAIDQMLFYSDDANFRSELMATRSDYSYIQDRARSAIVRMGENTKTPSIVTQASSWLNLSMSTMFDKSENKLSSLMLSGMDMAQKSIENLQQKNPESSSDSRALADELLDLQNRQRSVYRKHLS